MKALYSILLSALIFTACSTQDADVVIHNAKVYTVNDGFEVKSAVAIKDGRFIAVGGEEILNQYNAAKLDFGDSQSIPVLSMPTVTFTNWGSPKSRLIYAGLKVWKKSSAVFAFT